MEPRHFGSLYSLGLIRLQQNGFEDAAELFRRAVKVDKASAEAHYCFALALAGLGRLAEAILRYEKALALRPNFAEAHSSLGFALQMLGQIEKAIAHYKKALTIRPVYSEARNNLGNALQMLGRSAEAIAQYEKALESTPNDHVTHTNLGNVLGTLGRNEVPTPSGWVMKRETWQSVGGFNEKFRWHLDSDWLGRLTEKKFLRVHLVEATAPVYPQIAVQRRPWLANCLRSAGSTLRLLRHDSPWPLVKRHVHAESGTQRISKNTLLSIASQNEKNALEQRYGRIPW
jgi:tetratricopeptide (TPR) repeat protein